MMLFGAVQDEHRQLVRQCTKELEYQGRVEAMQAALADCGSVAAMPGESGTCACDMNSQAVQPPGSGKVSPWYASCVHSSSSAGAAGIVARLLQQLQRAGNEGAAEALRTLAKVCLEHSERVAIPLHSTALQTQHSALHPVF